MKRQSTPLIWVLAIIIFSQFCCTSLWFVGNSISTELEQEFSLNTDSLGYFTSAVQLGFLVGTLCYAFFSFADRFSPSRVFFISACLGALFNLGLIHTGNTMKSLLLFRFFTGFFLAGIYPVGMKIATDYYEKGLGKSLSFLVGALVLGTALPHLLKSIISGDNWTTIVKTTSSLAVFGGLLVVLFIPDGPFQKKATKFNPSQIIQVFKNDNFKNAAFGYFGHMWELYAFWAFTPLILEAYSTYQDIDLNIPLYSFVIIAIGLIACIIGGELSLKFGSKFIAKSALLGSGILCVVSPFIFIHASKALFIGYLMLWGMLVIADSPLLSSLVAKHTNPNSRGTALTIVTCIGFGISIISIQLLGYAFTKGLTPAYIFVILGLGPFLGHFFLSKSDYSIGKSK